MISQKIENLLNLALDTPPSERERSQELNIGYNPAQREWDLIIKYSGTLDSVRQIASSVTELINEYAILTIPEAQIPALTQLVEVEYIEKPKRLFFQVINGKRVSCIPEVQRPPESLSGKGTLVAIIDSGIDYTLPDFRNADGTTRIRNLWDQSIPGLPPAGYAIGTEFTAEDINASLQAQQPGNVLNLITLDTSGHGTAVAGIAAGNGRGGISKTFPGKISGQPSSTIYAGVAPESELLIVKMGNAREDGFPRTTELMLGVDYVLRKALEYRMPVAINISFGNTYGSHDGMSLLERFLDDISNYWKNVICIGSGNEGTGAGHTSGILTEQVEQEIQLGVQSMEPSVSVQIWKSYADLVDISIISPSGIRVGPIQEILGSQRFLLSNTEILLFYGEPSPYSVRQEIFLDFLPRESYIGSGVWRIILTPRRIVNGQFQMWLPSQNALNVGTAFLLPSADLTITIPSTSSKTISVGAYNPLTFTYADFSGRGALSAIEGRLNIKPTITAPGVNIMTTASGGGYTQVTGTSFATPFVTGSAALLMEWGIVNGNDPYLYGEKVKAYFQRGAKQLPGFEQYPNNQVGYGALCVKDSLPN